MARITVLRNDWSLEATVSSTNQAPDAAASRMLNYTHSERWVTNNLTTMRATFNAGSSLPWDTLALMYTNATSAATLTVTADDTEANLFTTPNYSRTQVFRLPYFREFVSWHSWHEAPTTQTHQYVGIEITDAANPDGFFSCGIAFIGNRLTPLLEGKVSGDTHEDLSIKLRMTTGIAHARRRSRKDSRTVTWEWLTEDEKEFFRSLSGTYGESTPIIIKIEPGSPIYEHANIIFATTGGIQVEDKDEFAMVINGIVYKHIGRASFAFAEV